MKDPDPSSSKHLRDRPGSEVVVGMEQDPTRGGGKSQRVRALEALRRVAETDRRVEPPARAVAAVKRLPQLRGLAAAAEPPPVRLILGFDNSR